MAVLHCTLDEGLAYIESPELDRLVGSAVGVSGVVVDVPDDRVAEADAVAAALRDLAVVAVARTTGPAPHWDVVVDDDVTVVAGIEANPQAAVLAAQVLRLTEGQRTEAGLIIESLAYATLHDGAEFAAWLDRRGRRSRRHDDQPRICVADDGEQVTITLNRPRLHNMLDVAMRDELVEALRALSLDGTDRPISLRGAGPTFCAGGDTGEFGTVIDAPTGHLIRSTANVAPWLDRLSSRVTAHIDGAAVGAGVELAAFCGRIEATGAAHFSLPELSMGLIPGAGGMVSIPRRIGRQRTLEWLLSNRKLDGREALDWGLVDSLT